MNPYCKPSETGDFINRTQSLFPYTKFIYVFREEGSVLRYGENARARNNANMRSTIEGYLLVEWPAHLTRKMTRACAVRSFNSEEISASGYRYNGAPGQL